MAENVLANEVVEITTATVSMGDDDASRNMYGVASLIQSQEANGRSFVPVCDISNKLLDQSIWVRGRLHTSRTKGRMWSFLPFSLYRKEES